MSSANAAAVTDAAPKPGSKKKLVIIAAAVAALLAAGGGGFAYVSMKKAAAAAEAEEGADAAPAPQQAKRIDRGAPPAFVALEPFVVNLADRDQERYAQIGITLELDDAKVGEDVKTYMPAIRNGILMILAHKTSPELLSREGKEKFAREVQRESARQLGVQIDDDEADEADAAASAAPKKSTRKRAPAPNPVRSVNFSSFIIQ
jgi:flagellar protein FliL